MKRYFKYLLLIILSIVLIYPTGCFAQDNMLLNEKGYVSLNGNPAKKMAIFNTNKGYAYCITPDKVGPKQGTSLTYKESMSDGGLIYLLTKATNEQTNYVYTQLAVWKYYNSFTEPASDAYWSGANTLVNEANNNKNYNTTPTLSITNSNKSASLTEDGDYYKSSAYKLSGSNLTGSISAQVSGAPTGTKIVDVSGNTVTNIKLGDTFYVWVPKANVSESTTFKINVSGNGYNSHIERYKDTSSDSQELIVLVKEKATVTDTTTFNINVTPKTCEKDETTGKYYNKSGVEVTYEEYVIDCESHTCYHIENTDTYFGKNGNIVNEETYKSECETTPIVVPDTSDNSNVIYIIFGILLISGTMVLIKLISNKKRA